MVLTAIVGDRVLNVAHVKHSIETKDKTFFLLINYFSRLYVAAMNLGIYRNTCAEEDLPISLVAILVQSITPDSLPFDRLCTVRRFAPSK